MDSIAIVDGRSKTEDEAKKELRKQKGTDKAKYRRLMAIWTQLLVVVASMDDEELAVMVLSNVPEVQDL